MNYKWLIVDGYNLLHQDESALGGAGLEAARQRLVRRVESAAAGLAPRITIVFDGRERGRDAAFDAPHLEVLFSPSGLTADGMIERMVSQAENPLDILVVTSDRAERDVVSAAGASTMSSADFQHRCEQAAKPVSNKGFGPLRNKSAKIGDFFPEG